MMSKLLIVILLLTSQSVFADTWVCNGGTVILASQSATSTIYDITIKKSLQSDVDAQGELTYLSSDQTVSAKIKATGQGDMAIGTGALAIDLRNCTHKN